MILGFSAGVMLSIVTFDLIPEALEKAPALVGLSGLVAGAVLLAFTDFFTPHVHFFSDDEESQRFIRTGMLVGVGIALHNLPEGLAIGAGFVSSPQFGLGIALLMAIQNVPEGMAMACPFSRTPLPRSKIIGATLLAGLPMGIGALLGAVFGVSSPSVLAFSLGFAAGAMLFITCDELIPDAQELRVGHSGTYGIVMGVLAGIVISITGNL